MSLGFVVDSGLSSVSPFQEMNERDERERERERVRVQEMLKKPGSQNVDRSLRQASLGPPCFWLHHPHLMKGSLLPQALIKQP